MPTFTVTIQREVVEEIKVNIETDNVRNIENLCPVKVISEGVVNSVPHSKWKTVVDDLWLDTEEVESTTAPADFVLSRITESWLFKKAPNAPKTDPRQLPLLPRDDE